MEHRILEVGRFTGDLEFNARDWCVGFRVRVIRTVHGTRMVTMVILHPFPCVSLALMHWRWVV